MKDNVVFDSVHLTLADNPFWERSKVYPQIYHSGGEGGVSENCLGLQTYSFGN